jgi:hypothetical protein
MTDNGSTNRHAFSLQSASAELKLSPTRTTGQKNGREDFARNANEKPVAIFLFFSSLSFSFFLSRQL